MDVKICIEGQGVDMDVGKVCPSLASLQTEYKKPMGNGA